MEIILGNLIWIDVFDSAVKVVSGILISGIFAYFILKSRRNHEINKVNYELKLKILKDISEQIEKSNTYLNAYSDLFHGTYLPDDVNKAKENSKLVISGFEAMTRAKSLTHLIDQKALSVALDNMCESLLEFYYFASDDIPNIKIDRVEENLIKALEKLRTLNKDMKALHSKVSDSYSSISYIEGRGKCI